MPKKWHGPSGKAAEALAKKHEQKTAEKERIQKEIEDEFWRDDDKNLQKKQQRKVFIGSFLVQCCLDALLACYKQVFLSCM